MSDEMLFRTRQKNNELIKSSYFMPFQKKRGYKHGTLPFQEHHRRAKEMTSKIKRKQMCEQHISPHAHIFLSAHLTRVNACVWLKFMLRVVLFAQNSHLWFLMSCHSFA